MLVALLLAEIGVAASVTVNPGDALDQLTTSLQAGDVVTFNDGVYVLDEPLHWGGDGTAQQPITMRAADGANPVLELTDGNWVVVLTDASHFAIEGLTFSGAADWQSDNAGGLRITGTLSRNVTVSGCTFRQLMGPGLRVDGNAQFLAILGGSFHDLGDDSAIDLGCGNGSCWVQDSTVAGNLVRDVAGQFSAGVVLRRGSHSVEVRDNVIAGTSYLGIYVGSTEFQPPHTVEGNAIWDVDGGGLWIQGAATVRNNLVFEVGGVGVRSSDVGRDTLERVVLSHNTVANTGDWAVQLQDWAGRDGMVFANNAVSNPTGSALQVAGEVPEDAHGAGNVVTGLVEGGNGWFLRGTGDAEFSDPTGWDFYPAIGSTLVGAGDPATASAVPSDDFNGLPRVDEPDVGAYAYYGPANPGWDVATEFKQLAGEVPGAGGDEPSGCACNDGSPAAAWLWVPIWAAGASRRRKGDA